MPPLSDPERSVLLRLARRSIAEAVRGSGLLETIPREVVLGESRGVFVTIHEGGRLRGCIGVIEPAESLGESVVRCAVSAALEDPRFPRVREEELPSLEIEISLLSKPQRIRPEEIEIGRHGLLITRGPHRGLLLPQVAVEHNLSRERFLEETCRKAGLPLDAWKDSGARISSFTCEILTETQSHSR